MTDQTATPACSELKRKRDAYQAALDAIPDAERAYERAREDAFRELLQPYWDEFLALEAWHAKVLGTSLMATGTGHWKRRKAQAQEVEEEIPKLKEARDALAKRMDADGKLQWKIFADFRSALDMSMSDICFAGSILSHRYTRHEFPHPEPKSVPKPSE